MANDSNQITITLDDLKRSTANVSADHIAGKDYLLLQLTSSNALEIPQSLKINCLSVFFCTRGMAEFRVDFNRVVLREGSIVFFNPNNVIEIDRSNENVDTECFAMFFSRDFVNLMNIDNNVLNLNDINMHEAPILQLLPEQSNIVERYFRLIYDSSRVTVDENVYSINIIRSLFASLIYQVILFANINSVVKTQQVVDETADASKLKLSRKNYYVRDFMRLVSENFRIERSVNFYASELFISPKYLSLIIKEATGYTATEWIDHYVTLEAKNLLRFSGRTIQQIAYDLNFNNQSSFGKYFKHQTGLSPSQFRKS